MHDHNCVLTKSSNLAGMKTVFKCFKCSFNLKLQLKTKPYETADSNEKLVTASD